jgi:hypothetical protein
MPILLLTEVYSPGFTRKVKLVSLEWNSNQNMLAHSNKSNISSTTLLIEHNTQITLYLKDSMKLMLKVKRLQRSLRLLRVSMRVGTMLNLKKENIQISDTTDSEDWELDLDHAEFMKLPLRVLKSLKTMNQLIHANQNLFWKENKI